MKIKIFQVCFFFKELIELCRCCAPFMWIVKTSSVLNLIVLKLFFLLFYCDVSGLRKKKAKLYWIGSSVIWFCSSLKIIAISSIHVSSATRVNITHLSKGYELRSNMKMGGEKGEEWEKEKEESCINQYPKMLHKVCQK